MGNITIKLFDKNNNPIEFVVDGKQTDKLEMDSIDRIKAKMNFHQDKNYNFYVINEVSFDYETDEAKNKEVFVASPTTFDDDNGLHLLDEELDMDSTMLIYDDEKDEPDLTDIVNLVESMLEYAKDGIDEVEEEEDDDNVIEWHGSGTITPEKLINNFFGNENEENDSSPIPNDYYTHNSKEAWDIIQEIQEFHNDGIDNVEAGLLFNVMKYLLRYPYKGYAIEDLEKAKTYIDKIINYISL